MCVLIIKFICSANMQYIESYDPYNTYLTQTPAHTQAKEHQHTYTHTHSGVVSLAAPNEHKFNIGIKG